MNGIVSYGAYIPYYRLTKGTAAEAFGKKAGKGEKAVAYCDEDSITMAVAAAMDAMAATEAMAWIRKRPANRRWNKSERHENM